MSDEDIVPSLALLPSSPELTHSFYAMILYYLSEYFTTQVMKGLHPLP